MSIALGFLRLSLAYIFTLSNTIVMTPIWLHRGFKLRSKNNRENPTMLQWYLSFHARAMLYWLARWQAQPLCTPQILVPFWDWLLGRLTVRIKPAIVRGKGKNLSRKEQRFNFDDASLPVSLKEEEKTKETIGLWFFNPEEECVDAKLQSATRNSPVLLYFHGGAYITLEAGDMTMGFTLARQQAKFGKMDILSVDYRLAPGSKYPTQLFEAFSAWKYLREMGYQTIFLGGDSAGANLTLLLWQYLDEVEKDAAAVAGLVLHSPWLDMNGFHRQKYKDNLYTCTLTPAYTQIGFKAIQTGDLPNARDPKISPIQWDRSTIARLPPVIITSGGGEALLGEQTVFVEKILSAGKSVNHYIVPGHPHDIGAMIWFYSKIERMHTYVGEWMRSTNL